MNNDQIRRELTYREYVQRENGVLRAPYSQEISFYNTVRNGDVEKVAKYCTKPLSEKEGLGVLSDDAAANIRYHFVITAAMLARVCIDGGMELSLAFTLSDYYIRKADGFSTVAEICDLHTVMCMDYAERMRRLHKEKTCSRPIVKCIEFIYSNLNTRITLERLAQVAGLSQAYLSRLFKQETGVSVSGYIADKKLETAENMLIYSDYSPAWISSVLAFSSQSYFCECFKKRTGLTPLQFRAGHSGGALTTEKNMRRQ